MERKSSLFVKSFVCVGIVLGMVINLISPLLNVQAQESIARDISDWITELSLVERDSKTVKDSYQDWDWLTLSAKFDDTRGKIQGGDYIFITWPSNSQASAWIESFFGEKPLYIEGQQVGKYTVDAKGAKLVFNDKINSMQNVSGNFSFDVRIHNNTESDQSLTISSGQTFTIAKVDKVISASRSKEIAKQEWRSEKVGNLSTHDGKNIIVYGIYLNSNHAQLAGDITLEDEIQAGMKLDKQTISVRIGDNYVVPFADFSHTFPKSWLTFEDGVIRARFSKDEFSGKRFSISYCPEIVDASIPVFQNVAKVGYQLVNEAPRTIENRKSVKGVIFDANVYGVLPKELKIIKKVKGENTTIAGVTFEISGPNQFKQTATTDANGMISLKNLTPGIYQAREIVAPDEYAFDSQKIYNIEVLKNGQGEATIIYNDKKTTEISLRELTPSKKEILWTELTPATKVIPWTELTPATKVIPWTELTPATKVIPWTELTPATKVIPWTELTSATKVIPWTELTAATKVIPWTELTPSTKVITWTELTTATKDIPWTELTPATKVIPWTELTPATKVIPWTELTSATKVIPWTELTPATKVIPWTELTPSKKAIPWTELTPATKVTTPVAQQKKNQTSTTQDKKRLLPESGYQESAELLMIVLGSVCLMTSAWLIRKKVR